MDFANPLSNAFVKKDGQECFVINVSFNFAIMIQKQKFHVLQPFAPRIAFMEVVRFLVNVCVTQAGLVQIVTNAWRIRTVCMVDVLIIHFSANVMMDMKGLAVKSLYAVKVA